MEGAEGPTLAVKGQPIMTGHILGAHPFPALPENISQARRPLNGPCRPQYLPRPMLHRAGEPLGLRRIIGQVIAVLVVADYQRPGPPLPLDLPPNLPAWKVGQLLQVAQGNTVLWAVG